MEQQNCTSTSSSSSTSRAASDLMFMKATTMVAAMLSTYAIDITSLLSLVMALNCLIGPARNMLESMARKFPTVYITTNGVGFPFISAMKRENDRSVRVQPATKQAPNPQRRCLYVIEGQHASFFSSSVSRPIDLPEGAPARQFVRFAV